MNEKELYHSAYRFIYNIHTYIHILPFALGMDKQKFFGNTPFQRLNVAAQWLVWYFCRGIASFTCMLYFTIFTSSHRWHIYVCVAQLCTLVVGDGGGLIRLLMRATPSRIHISLTHGKCKMESTSTCNVCVQRERGRSRYVVANGHAQNNDGDKNNTHTQTLWAYIPIKPTDNALVCVCMVVHLSLRCDHIAFCTIEQRGWNKFTLGAVNSAKGAWKNTHTHTQFAPQIYI